MVSRYSFKKILTYIEQVVREYILFPIHKPAKANKIIWLIGSPRSGTTIFQNLINCNNDYIPVFEPFSKRNLYNFNEQYFYQDCPHKKELNTFFKNIINLKGINTWMLRDFHPKIFNKYSNILIKDVHINLMAYGLIKNTNCRIKTILLIRNPFDVFTSQDNLRHWNWIESVYYFLNMPNLMGSILKPFENEIKRIAESRDYVLNKICIWCIQNYVPINQFRENDLLILNYESIFYSIDSLTEKLEGFLEVKLEKEKIKGALNIPSSTTVNLNNSKQYYLDDNKIKECLEIISMFGLTKYLESSSSKSIQN